MDLDDFKLINDRHGHAVGDRLLAAVAEAAGSALRSADIAARWGGEEFALVLATATSDGIEVVERLLRAVRELRIVTAEGYSFGCTASIGMALPTPDTERFEMLIERADRAMTEPS